jgi:tetratricopeptide (TPR) repeat protein
MAAASGDLARARGFFNPANFPQEKQEELVRVAYIELELQRLLALAAEHKCADVDRLLTTIGAEDKRLPFTFHPFGDLMKGARFQYYFGEAEAACVDEKSARKRFEKVARMKPDADSPDFAYPYLASARLGAAVDASTALEHSQRYLESGAGSRPALLYNRGLLLLLTGRKMEAIDCFRLGAKAAPPGMLRYVNTLALRTSEQQ